MTPIFRAKIERGKPVFENAEKFAEHIRSLEGKVVSVTVCLPRKQRSNPQNNYFHGILCKIIGDSLGYSLQEIKGILKWLHLPPGVGTSDLNTAEAEDFYAKCRMWASVEHNIIVPLPNEVL